MDDWHKMKTPDGREYQMLNTVDFVFIIESATKGEFRGFDRSVGSDEYKPRWLTKDSITRRSPEVWKTNNATDAVEMIGRVLQHHKTAYLVRMTRYPTRSGSNF